MNDAKPESGEDYYSKGFLTGYAVAIEVAEQCKTVEELLEMLRHRIKEQDVEKTNKKLAEQLKKYEEGYVHQDLLLDCQDKLTQTEKKLDFLVELCGEASKWPKELWTYPHTIGHIENVISNLRCDLRTEARFRKHAEAKVESYERQAIPIKGTYQAYAKNAGQFNIKHEPEQFEEFKRYDLLVLERETKDVQAG